MSSDAINYPELRNSIDEGALSWRQWLLIAVCFLLNVADGFDVVAMAVAAPSISAEWELNAGALGIIFSSALAGMTLGAMGLSVVGDRIGRRRVLLVSTAAIAIAMIATAWATTIPQLVAYRFIAGLGIGGVLANAAALTAEYAPARHRSAAVILMQAGFSVGSVIVGPIAAILIASSGWQHIFLYGGLFGAALTVLVFLFVPESLEFVAARNRPESENLDAVNRILQKMEREPVSTLSRAEQTTESRSSITSLLAPKLRMTTLRLWVIFFLSFWATYFLVSWIPKLFVQNGLEIRQGIFALTVYTIGGLAGAMTLSFMSNRGQLTQLIRGLYLACVAALVLFVLLDPKDVTILYAFMIAIGFTQTGGFTGMYAVAAQSYPTSCRATGVGWCVGLGRAGAVLSPAIAGFLVAASWSMQGLFWLLAIPTMLVAALLLTPSLGAEESPAA